MLATQALRYFLTIPSSGATMITFQVQRVNVEKGFFVLIVIGYQAFLRRVSGTSGSLRSVRPVPPGMAALAELVGGDKISRVDFTPMRIRRLETV